MARSPIGPRARIRARAALASILVGAVLLLTACASPTPPRPTESPRPIPPPSLLAAAVYYVDCSRPTNGSGTHRSPWNTAASIAAHGSFRPGEHVLLRRGTTCSGRVLPTGSGTNGDPIVLGAYGSGPRPVVAGGGTPDQTGAVQLTDVHDWVVEDLEVTNLVRAGPDATLRAGILVVDEGSGLLGRITVRSNPVRRVTSSPGGATADPHTFGGIVVLVRGTAARSTPLADVRVEDNLVDHVGRVGVVVWSDAWPKSPLTGVWIAGNRVIDPDGDGIVTWGVDGAVIEHNTEDGGGRLPPCPRCAAPVANTASAGIWPVMSTHVLVRYNEVFGVGAAGGDGQGFDIDDSTSEVVLEGNYSHDNEGGGVLICGARDSVIRSNVFANDGGGEITFSCPLQRDALRVVNNTFFLAADSSTQVVRHNRTGGTAPLLFANNVVIDDDDGGYSWPLPVTAQGDLYAGVIPASAPTDATGPIDPGLVAPGTGGTGLESVGGFRPLPDSAAASGGVDLPDAGALDYFGSLRVGPPGRGAIAATHAPPALAPVEPTATRSGADIALSWTADAGTGWLVQRKIAGGPFRTMTGVLTGGRFTDVAPPLGALRYRLIQSGRDTNGAPSDAVPDSG